MKNKKKIQKDFDAVAFMREARDKISLEITSMTPSEIVAYFQTKTSNEPKKLNV